ncbi:MAG: carboxyl transferase domain-containing protein, partial [Desulfurococcaceae archaeon]
METRDLDSLLNEIKLYREKSIIGGGKDKIDAQRSKGKLWVRDRIEKLLDPGSFEEIQWMRTHESTFFGLDKIKYYGDGVIIGYGKIDGRIVYIYAQDFTVMGGSIGKSHGEKIAYIIEQAIINGSPVIGIYDSGGARIQEGVDSLHGCGRIFAANVKASGVIPQISL